MQIPFALSLSKYLNSAGGDAGFASLLAVALLVILYFAHARETKTLRERLGEAHDRIDALEARLAQMMQMQSLRQQQAQPQVAQRPAATPAPVARPMGSAVAALKREPAASTDETVQGAPYGVGAPALLSATHALPELAAPGTAPVKIVSPTTATSPDENTMLVAPGEAQEANGERPAAVRAVAAPAMAAASAAGGRGGPRGGNGAPPRVQIRPEAPSGTAIRRPGQPPRGSLLDEPPRGPSRVARVLGAVGAVAAIVVIVIVLTKLTSNSATSNSSASKVTTTSSSKNAKAAKFNPHDVTVAVLNGTSVSGLAKDVSQHLAKQGYRAGNITNAAVQTEKSTIVYYVPHQQVAAQHVATALKLKPSAVQLATPSVTQSCATVPGAAASASTCQGDVIVSVGADRANLASAGKTS